MRKLLLIFATIATIPALAQTLNDSVKIYTEGEIKVLAKVYKDSVVLRWAPNNHIAWAFANKGAYLVKRKTISKDSVLLDEQEVLLTPDSIKCMSLEKMKSYLGPNSQYGPIAAQAIYGKDFVTSKEATPGNILNKKIEQENRYGFALYAADNDPRTATAIGLRYVDKTVRPGYFYTYTVQSIIPQKNYTLFPGVAAVNTVNIPSIPQLPQISTYGFENTVRLDWDAKDVINEYSGYFVEKRKKNGGNWKQINTVPIVAASPEPALRSKYFFNDSVTKDYEVWEYRISAINAFGEKITSEQIAEGYGRDRTPPAGAYNITADAISNNAIEIKWKKTGNESDFIGFYIQKGTQADGPWYMLDEKLLSKEARSFVDTKPDMVGQNYYRVLTLDTARNVALSFSVYAILIDSIAPSEPTTPTGSIDSNGIVKISWKIGKEDDILGYRVFSTNQEDHEYANLTPDPLFDTMFIDTISLKTLTKKIYYKIVAVDRHFNHSVPSKPLILKRPDVNPPVTPVFTNVWVSDTLVKLEWINSSSDDVKKTILYRQENNGALKILAEFERGDVNSFKDRDLVKRKSYRYFLQAIDESGLLSAKSYPADALIYDNGKRKAISNLTADYDKKTKSVQLNWNYEKSDKFHFVIYRSYNGSDFTVYKSADGTSNSYADWDLLGDGEYTYGIKVFYKDGGQSVLSNTVRITIK